LSYLGRDDEALVEFRSTLPALAAAERWNAYASVLNGIGGCLLRLGGPQEARREYARALRQVSRQARPAVHAFIRANLARALFQAGRYEEAARAFENASTLFAAQGARADELSMALFRVEALARCGALEEARRSFAVFAIAGRSTLDPDLLESLETVLRGDIPDADLLARLRGRAETQLADRLRRAS
ncbi:MAG: tetratricopeptide repeat protein, partial [Thermoanaerobaculia bacterium]|nr:tetratricopeptide repeat protein [Thermoanaerobaculia bacterium]